MDAVNLTTPTAAVSTDTQSVTTHNRGQGNDTDANVLHGTNNTDAELTATRSRHTIAIQPNATTPADVTTDQSTTTRGVVCTLSGRTPATRPRAVPSNTRGIVAEQEEDESKVVDSGEGSRSVAKSDKPRMECSICRDTIKEPAVTKCGHSFCTACIHKHLEYARGCPVCGKELFETDLFHNFLLDDLMSGKNQSQIKDGTARMKDVISLLQTREHIDDTDIEVLLKVLHQKRAVQLEQSEILDLDVMCEFFKASLDSRRTVLRKLQDEIFMLERDHEVGSLLRAAAQDRRESSRIARVAGKRTFDEMCEMGGPDATFETSKVPPSTSTEQLRYYSVTRQSRVPTVTEDIPSTSSRQISRIEKLFSPSNQRLETKKTAVHNHLTNITKRYFEIRRNTFDNREALSDFRNILKDCTRYSRLEEKSFFAFSGLYNHSSIVSSIEFDKEGQYFATAGVSKSIKLFDFDAMAADPRAVDRHIPSREMTSTAKISCLAWNPYIKQQIASCDYDGLVQLWDTVTGQATCKLQEHDKRAWSVNFCERNPQLLASGSDDSKVKIWSTNRAQSVKTIQSSANVCCVRFSPTEPHYLAFGGADHHIHYYDLRAPQRPLALLKGHKKAVSYVRFLSNNEIASASTDSTLKLWKLDQTDPIVETFTGHSNTRNFVGLTSNGDYIACGSENNAVYAYYKGLSSPVAQYRFATFDPITGEEVPRDDVAHFVSSVCWKV
ncbi:hypothetical protein, variant [Sphaeroforma arctica JP610]|uniref:RING-type domain-containing protein n=1 Tax=Sphaeroforma arctica JP610 TaxID=667725 RepID=A0A0L0FM28_9EUKA|nr:hypothetical protein, variant [Sphaeroforma arctica JP610]KNC77536.1 hypothetical protein, variant [Sphaeroforma arctica JP610]|eukprot:XP_014151438.1 hypothetical protein, variant [Sphaeroforma arctica JP610]